MRKKLNLILTSIFIVLFVVVFFSNFSYANTADESRFYTRVVDFVDTNEALITNKANYDNCIAIYSSTSFYSDTWYYLFFNGDLALLNNNNNSWYSSNIVQLNMVYFYTSGTTNVMSNSTSDGSSSYTIFNLPIVDNNPINTFNDHYITLKGNFGVTINGENAVTPVTPYDFSFVINDKSSNTDHNFDFIFQEGSFNDGRSFVADDIKEGHYIVSITSLVHNQYNFGNNENEDTYWVCGYLDFVDYSSSPQHCFVWSSGYNIPKILNDNNDNDYTYRFYFKGYSSDSYLYDDLHDSSNIIQVSPSNYGLESKYKYPKGSTFAYSNRDIYYAQDSSLYGFSGITNKLFFDESEYDILFINEISTSELPSDSDYLDNQVTSFALNNDVYNYPSSSVTLNNDALFTYSNSSLNEINSYSSEQNLRGNSNVDVDTQNWSTTDYLSHLPQQISNLPTAIGDTFNWLITPNENSLKFLIIEFKDFLDNHFGSFYEAFEFVFDTLNKVLNDYTTEGYYFYMPSIRWYNPVKGEKETLVEARNIWLGSFMEDEDWLMFWTTEQYVVSFLIYLSLIFMLYNKFLHFFNGSSSYLTNSSVVGDVVGNYLGARHLKADNLYHRNEAPVDHTWKGGSI